MPMAPSLPERVDAPSGALSRTQLGLAGAFLFAGLTAIGAQVNVPIPPFGVPMTLQTLFVVLSAVCLGPKWGAISMVAYIGAGAIGAPIFSEGRAGLGVILGQTAGYIFGFLACQPVVRMIVRRGRDGLRRPLALWLAVACLAAHMVVFLFGVPVLYLVRALDGNLEPITWGGAIYGGFVVFIPGMIIKCAMATIIGLWLAPHAARRLW